MKNKLKKFLIIYFIIFANLLIKDLYAEIPVYELKAKKITYTDNNNTIIAEGDAHAKDKLGREIFSDFIIYDKAKSVIRTKFNSKYRDLKNNLIDADVFIYDLKLNKILAKNKVKYLEKNGNTFYFSEFEYFDNSNTGYGRDARAIMLDKSSFESKYLEIDNNTGTINLKNENANKNFFYKIKSLFIDENRYTTCENYNEADNIKEQCPDWSLSTLQTTHDSKKKMVYHNHALIKLRNIPVFYTPYFSHPDPSVKRKSGFMPVSTKNFNDLGRTLKIPYFWVIDDESDLTFTPVFYQDENHIYLADYRKQNKNSKLQIDTSYSSGYKNLNKEGDSGQTLNRTSGSRNHFFLNFNGQYDNILFKNTDLQVDVQRISQKNYLNVNQINTEILRQDISNLNNSITINSYRNNEKLQISASIYENLSIDDPNTKYQYKIPYIDYNNFFKKFNQNISLSSIFDANNFQGDSKKIIQRNIVNIDSEQKIIKNLGIANNIQIKTSNLNYYNENISNEKQNLNNEFYTTFALKNSLPMIKLNADGEETLQPNIFTKYTTGATSSVGNGKILNYGDIYSLDRLSSIDNPETGLSLGYGVEYSLIKKNNENLKYLSSDFAIGQIFTDKNNNSMPSSSSLNKKSSNLVGNLNFFLDRELMKNINLIEKNTQKINNLEEGFNLNYNFNISNDLNKILKNDLNLSLNKNKNKLIGSYYELNEIGNTKYLDLKYEKAFSNNINFIMGGRKNLKLDYTERNFIETNYESDCLKLGINLSKTFYQSDDLQKSNNLTIFITLKPFGKPISPDLTNLIN